MFENKKNRLVKNLTENEFKEVLEEISFELDYNNVPDWDDNFGFLSSFREWADTLDEVGEELKIIINDTKTREKR